MMKRRIARQGKVYTNRGKDTARWEKKAK